MNFYIKKHVLYLAQLFLLHMQTISQLTNLYFSMLISLKSQINLLIYYKSYAIFVNIL